MGKLIRYLYIIMMGIIFILLFFVDTSVHYSTIETEKLPNIVLLGIILGVVCIFGKFYTKHKENINEFIEQNYYKILVIGTIIVFLIQLFVIYHIYLYTGWDCKKVTDAARFISNGHIPKSKQALMDYYYSTCPNNIMLTEIFSKLYVAFRWIGLNNGYVGLIGLGICIVDFVAVIVAKTARMLFESRKYGLLAWIIYAIWIAQLPWTMIPYTDIYAIIFPVLEVYLYLLYQKNKGITKVIIGFILGCITGIAYFIKPTVMIVMIAIVIYEIINMFNEKKYNSFITILLCCIIGFSMASTLNGVAKKDLKQYININEEKALSMPHYMMMGMNTEHYGTYLRSDRVYSASFPTKKSRTQADISVIKKRLKAFGVVGYAKFLAKKTLVNYNSGTMAWGREGKFNYKKSTVPETTITKTLRSFYYNKGENYSIVISYAQSIWLFVLASGFISAIMAKNKKISNYEVLLLSIIGITAFTLLFEARARYLYIMTPIYILVACYGIKNIKYCNKIKMTKNKK